MSDRMNVFDRAGNMVGSIAPAGDDAVSAIASIFFWIILIVIALIIAFIASTIDDFKDKKYDNAVPKAFVIAVLLICAIASIA